jgi:thioredoxin 1
MIPNEGKALVQFGASWCSPCKAIKPTAEELAKANEAQYIYIDVGQDDGFAFANAHNVRNVPVIIAFKDGQELGRATSAVPREVKVIVNNCFGG